MLRSAQPLRFFRIAVSRLAHLPRACLPRLLLCAAAGAAVALVFVRVQCRPAPPRDISSLLERVRPLGLHMAGCMASGDVRTGVYLCSRPRPRPELQLLLRQAGHIDQWSGVVLVTQGSPSDEGEPCGPFLLFGDPELVARVRAVLEH